MDLTNLRTIKSILKKHNLWAKKRLGQNFLINKYALKTIVESAKISKSDHIIEIGPGLGVLTKELASLAKKVTTIELDKTLLPILKETLKFQKNVEIINKDALKFTPPKTKYKVVANIPYQITSPLLNRFLQAKNKPTSLTLLIQKEVAQKICSKKHSILSLQVNLFGKPKIIKKVPASSFYPSPKVDSAIIHIELFKKSDPEFIPQKEALKILSLAKTAFSQKRKKLSNTLKPLLPKLKKLNLTDKRPEDLKIQDWQTLIQN